MKRILTLLAVSSLCLGVFWWSARAQNQDETAVRAALENYLQGHATGQGEYYRKIFHPDSKLFAVREGKYWQLTSEEFIARATGKPAADEAQRKRWIESVDIAGNAASAKIVLDYPQVKMIDYMSLLKIDGEWKIINKTFDAQPKTK